MPDSLVHFHPQARHVAVEVDEKAKAITDCEFHMRLAASALLCSFKVFSDEKRQIGVERIQELLEALVGDCWADVRKRADEEGVAVEPFPTLGD